MTRRELMRGAASAALPSFAQAQSSGRPSDAYRNYFGDLHNHNDVGYAQGSLTRSFEVARNHLDFYAFTPHSYWPDVGHYDGKIENKWKHGFAVAKARWPDVVELARQYDEPGEFVTILGYERHGAAEGDYHILFPDLAGDYELIEDLRELQAFAKRRGCIMVPHHLQTGSATAHFVDQHRRLVSPVLEIYSEWGNAEHDRAPRPYKRHTEGGRWTKHTLHSYLEQGHRLGVVASTDDHLGYPGGYREGLAVIKATELSRDSIFDALRARRCYAVSGDRIALDFELNGAMMGSELPYARERRMRVAVRGWDQVDRVEILKNNRVIHRDFRWIAKPRRELKPPRAGAPSTAGALAGARLGRHGGLGFSAKRRGRKITKQRPASPPARSMSFAATASSSATRAAFACSRSPRSNSKSTTGRRGDRATRGRRR
ncbi:MAG: DUF3604 domain-containing protein [Bryobacterales bacterium]